LGAHELGRPELARLVPQGVAAPRSPAALAVALADGPQLGRDMRSWAVARQELRAACAAAEQSWERALHAAESLRADVTAARLAVDDHAAALSRLTAEMEPPAPGAAPA